MEVQVECARRLFTADEYMRMADVGILGEDERIELIRGEILTMSPIGPRHCTFVDRFTYVLVTALGARAWVRVQGTVRLFPDTMPEPDLAILRRETTADAHPTPEDILLVIEVAETSLAYDRGREGGALRGGRNPGVLGGRRRRERRSRSTASPTASATASRPGSPAPPR